MKDAMPFRSPETTKPERIAPPPALSAHAPVWQREVQAKEKRSLTGTPLFRLLLLWASLIVVFYTVSCGFPRLLDQIDGQYAGAAREMISRHDWLVPTQNGIPRLRKPPLAYWMERLSLESFGQNEFAARLPVCLATFAWFIASAMLAYDCTRDRRTSMASAVILASFFGTFQFSHLVMPEPAFGFFVTFAFWMLVRLIRKMPGEPSEGASFSRLRSLTELPNQEGKASSGRLSLSSNSAERGIGVLEYCPPASPACNASRSECEHGLREALRAGSNGPFRNRTRRPRDWRCFQPELLLLWISMALAVLCKGVHGLLLPLGVLSVASVFRSNLRPLCRRVAFSGIGWLVFVALVCPWYLAVEHRYPGFILDQLANEQVNMLIGRRWPVDGDHLSLLNFWIEQLGVLFPWTLLIPGGALVSFRVLSMDRRISQPSLLLLLWFFIYAIAITFANLQDYYLLICLPVIAIWLAWAIRRGIPSLFSAWIPGVLLALLGAGAIALSSQQLVSISSSGQTGRGEQPAINSVASAIVNVAGATGRTLSNTLLLFGICALVIGLLTILFRRRPQAPLVLLPPFVLLICLLGLKAEVALQDYLSSASIASVINHHSDASTLIVSKGNISDRTSLYFYLQRQLHWLDGDPDQEYATRRYARGQDLYLKMPDLIAAWHSSRKVCVILDHDSLNSLAADLNVDPGAVRVLATTPTDVVVVNW